MGLWAVLCSIWASQTQKHGGQAGQGGGGGLIILRRAKRRESSPGDSPWVMVPFRAGSGRRETQCVCSLKDECIVT